MRLTKMFVIAAFAMAAAGVVLSQPPGQPKGGFGKGKGGQPIDEMTLFQNPQVRAELKVSDQQLANLPAASHKALAEVLTAGQLQRLRGIYLQAKGNAAFLDTAVVKELQTTPDQTKAIKTALDAQMKQQNDMAQAG